MYIFLATVFLGFVSPVNAALSCPEELPLSCSDDAKGVDTCCVFSPGLLELSQVWKKERQQWVIDNIRVLSCDGLQQYSNCGPAYPPDKILNLVEGYARHIVPLTDTTRSLGWGGIAFDASDGDVTAMWARQWAQHGSCISTFSSKCIDKAMPPGEEEAWDDPGPALFVQTMHQLQRKLMKTKGPHPNELPQQWHYLYSFGSPHLGNFVEDHSLTEDTEKRWQKVGKLSFFAQREQLRAQDEYNREHTGRIDHDEL